MPLLGDVPKGSGVSPPAEEPQPEGLQPTPWVQEAFKGSHSADFITALNSTRAEFPLEVKFGAGMLSLPFFFGVLEVQKAPQARHAALHRNARVRFFLHRRA